MNRYLMVYGVKDPQSRRAPSVPTPQQNATSKFIFNKDF